jgi:hypothetical protein
MSAILRVEVLLREDAIVAVSLCFPRAALAGRHPFCLCPARGGCDQASPPHFRRYPSIMTALAKLGP